MKRHPVSDQSPILANAAPVGSRPPRNPGNITPDRIVMSIRQKFSAIRRITPELLGTQLDQYQRGYLSPIMRTWEAMERRDDRMSAVAPKSKSSLARHGFEILALDDSDAAKEHKAALDYFYDNLTVTDSYDENKEGGFSLLVETMADAIGYKYSVHEILWEPSASGLTATFRHAPGWFFENITGRLRFLTQDFNYYGVEMNPDEWLTTVMGGIDEACSVAYMFKHLPLKDWLNFSEKFGFPGILGKTSASKGSEQWNAMRDAVANFANDFAAVCNVGDTIEMIKADGGSANLPFAPIIEKMDRAISILWRGADLGTESHRGTGKGQGASLQEDETADLDEARSMRISETLNIQIDRRVIAWTYGSDVKPLAYVRLKTKPRRDLAFDLTTIQALTPMGVPFEVSDVLERFGWSAPKPGATLLTAPATPAPLPDEKTDDADLANEAVTDLQPLARAIQKTVDRGVVVDFKPLIAAIRKIQDSPEGHFAEHFHALAANAPALARKMTKDQAAADAIEKALGTVFVSGLVISPSPKK